MRTRHLFLAGYLLGLAGPMLTRAALIELEVWHAARVLRAMPNPIPSEPA